MYVALAGSRSHLLTATMTLNFKSSGASLPVPGGYNDLGRVAADDFKGGACASGDGCARDRASTSRRLVGTTMHGSRCRWPQAGTAAQGRAGVPTHDARIVGR